MQRFLFCPGAIFGTRGWTPVIRVSRDGRPAGSKTCAPFATRDEAEAHAIRAAHRAVRAVSAAFKDEAEFIVRVPAAHSPALVVEAAIAEALAAPKPEPVRETQSFVAGIMQRLFGREPVAA